MKENQFFLMFPINRKCRHFKDGMRELEKLYQYYRFYDCAYLEYKYVKGDMGYFGKNI